VIPSIPWKLNCYVVVVVVCGRWITPEEEHINRRHSLITAVDRSHFMLIRQSFSYQKLQFLQYICHPMVARLYAVFNVDFPSGLFDHKSTSHVVPNIPTKFHSIRPSVTELRLFLKRCLTFEVDPSSLTLATQRVTLSTPSTNFENPATFCCVVVSG